jgi:hypothetical protein
MDYTLGATPTVSAAQKNLVFSGDCNPNDGMATLIASGLGFSGQLYNNGAGSCDGTLTLPKTTTADDSEKTVTAEGEIIFK